MEAGEYSLYQTFVAQCPTALVYHTLDWQRVIQHTYGYTPCYVLTQETGRGTGILPLFEVSSLISGRHLVAIPFSHHVPALYENENVLRILVDRAQQIARQRGCKYLEVRGSAQALSELGFQVSTHNWISQLDLDVTGKKLWNNLNSSTRRNIKKAGKNNIIVRHGTDTADFAAFYRLILETRRYQGVFPYPARLFTALQTMSQAELYLACHKEHILAGVIVFCYGKRVIYAYGASVKDPQVLRLRPNDLLFWHIISDIQARDYEIFDLGTTPIGHENLLRFKEKWGAQSKSLAYAYWLNTTKRIPVMRRDSQTMKVVNAVIRRMPLWSLRFIGELLFKQLG